MEMSIKGNSRTIKLMATEFTRTKKDPDTKVTGRMISKMDSEKSSGQTVLSTRELSSRE